jgi:hypothetical protein
MTEDFVLSLLVAFMVLQLTVVATLSAWWYES